MLEVGKVVEQQELSGSDKPSGELRGLEDPAQAPLQEVLLPLQAPRGQCDMRERDAQALLVQQP